ncbi:MAG: hypothetical protein J6A59_05300 [Lachnospiraceae bacterium]|nr:hypothetical protein [Lachnospiraceae bacterium]
MRILDSENRFSTEITIKKEWIERIKFETDYELNIMEQYAEYQYADRDLLNILKFFNTDIHNLNSKAWTYTVLKDGKKKILPINRLSNGERLFVLCYMADITKNNIIVCYELSQLAKPSILKFFEMFNNSDYITIVPPTPSMQHLYKSLSKGVIKK